MYYIVQGFAIKEPEQKSFTLQLPKGAKIINITKKQGVHELLALIKPGEPTEARYFIAASTGMDIERNLDKKITYIDTYQLEPGNRRHVFEILK